MATAMPSRTGQCVNLGWDIDTRRDTLTCICTVALGLLSALSEFDRVGVMVPYKNVVNSW